MIVSIEDVRRIANYEELAAHFQTDLREPPEADTNVPGPCRVVGWSHVYRLKSSVFISVGVLGIEPAEPIANVILQTISDRIQ